VLPMDEKQWKIGELARATGLTVRTLHHYDEIGLLIPSERTQAGYRLYGEHDVRRLYEIRALRDLGIPLGEIPEALDGEVRTTLARHLERIEQDLERGRRLRSLLKGILDGADSASGTDYMEAIEAMTMFEKYYTPDQLEQIEERRRSFSQEEHDRFHQDWEDLIAAANAEKEKGTDPSDPRMQEIATRWRELIDLFTGGDEGILGSLKTMFEEEGPERASRGAIDSELQDYVGQALRLQL
jgi:MerR family transcriptional regulator, thiopeptide resistance regulator